MNSQVIHDFSIFLKVQRRICDYIIFFGNCLIFHLFSLQQYFLFFYVYFEYLCQKYIVYLLIYGYFTLRMKTIDV